MAESGFQPFVALNWSYVGSTPSLKGTKQQQPDINTVALSIYRALMMGDRSFALLKLQDLWAEGWRDDLEELCYLRKDWGFRVHDQGVTNGN